MNTCTEHLHLTWIQNSIIVRQGGSMVCISIGQICIVHGSVVSNGTLCRFMSYVMSCCPFLGSGSAIDVTVPLKGAVRTNLGASCTPGLFKAHTRIGCTVILSAIAFGTVIK